MASLTASTISQARGEFQYSTSVAGLLKNVYIPALNNVTFHATPLMEMFGDFGGTIDFAGNKIIKAFKTQLAGGFGGIAEGGDWVHSKNQRGFQGAERIKYLNAYVSITGPAAKTVRSGEGAYVDAISSAMDDTLKNARMNMERIIGGNGLGHIASFTATAQDYATIRSCTALAANGGYSPCQWLQEGMLVDMHDDAVGTIAIGSGAQQAGATGMLVTLVDYAAGTFSLTGPSACTPAGTATKYLVIHDSWGDVETEGDPNGATSCLEPNGLTNLVDDSSTYTSWGLVRATYPRALKSKVVAAGSAELDEELMMGWVLDMVNIQQSVPNVCVVDPKSRLKYFSNRKEDRRFDMPVIDTPFGFRSTGVVIDQYTLMLQSLASLAPGTLYMLNTNAFKFAKATDGFEWVTSENGSVFRQKEGSDNLYASAVNYMNFVCEDPKGQLKVTGLSY